MPRKYLPINSEFPYHISARTNNQDWFSISLKTVWEIMSEQLFFANHAYGLKIHSFVLMANHFHLLATSPSGNLSSAMNYFMRETSRAISRESGRTNHVYGGRYHKSLISNSHYYFHAYKYVYRNPIEAEICQRAEDYEFSTLFNLLGREKTIIPLVEDTILFENLQSTLDWLNRKPAVDTKEKVKRALRKTVFAIGNDNGGCARPNNLLTSSY